MTNSARGGFTSGAGPGYIIFQRWKKRGKLWGTMGDGMESRLCSKHRSQDWMRFFLDFIFPIKLFSWQSRRRKGYTRLQPVKEQSRKGGRGKIPPDSFEKPTAFREEEKSFFPSDSSLHSVASITSRFVGRGGEYDPHSQSRG